MERELVNINHVIYSDLLKKLKAEAHENHEKYEGHYYKVINDIVDAHYKQKEKNTAKKVNTMSDDRTRNVR